MLETIGIVFRTVTFLAALLLAGVFVAARRPGGNLPGSSSGGSPTWNETKRMDSSKTRR